MASTTERTIINAAGLAQGIVCLVTFPAASTIFTDTSQYGLSSSEYGTMFLSQVALAAEQGTHHQLRHACGPYQRMWENEYVPCVRQSMNGDGRAGSFNFIRVMSCATPGMQWVPDGEQRRHGPDGEVPADQAGHHR